MKRFFFICVALIAFAATNASGTNYQATSQLQTCYQADHPIVLLPAISVAEYVFEAPAVKAVGFITPADQEIWVLFKPAVYHNPDYGLCSFNRFLLSNDYQINRMVVQIKDIGKLPNIKLPTQFVQLE